MGYLVVLVVVILVATVLQPSAPEPQPGTIDAGKLPTIKEGSPIPKVFGRRIIEAPNIAYYGALSTRKVQTKSGK